MKINNANLYFCPNCKGKILQKDNIIIICPFCGDNRLAIIPSKTIDMIL